MATYNHVNGPVVPHLDTTAASSSSGGTGAAYVIISLLGVNEKRGSNRGGNNKRSHCSCHGCGTSPAFVVGLLDVDDKIKGNRDVGAVAGWQRRRRRPGVCCRPAWRRGGGQEGQWVTGGNRRTQPAHTLGRCAIEIGVMVLVTDAQGHPEW